MNFFNTFRGRLLLVLVFLLVATLAVQYYVNLRNQEENINITEMREQALLAGFALGVNSMTSQDRLRDFVQREGQSFYNERTKNRISDILVIDNEWQVYDSLSDEYLPTESEDGSVITKDLREIKDLPPLKEQQEKLGDDIKNFPNANPDEDEITEMEAHAIPVETDRGRFYVMVILRNDGRETFVRAAQPLVFTLAILLASAIVAMLLVWQFTRPIANLSKAARRVGRGDLSFRVPSSGRSDEIGTLTAQFNLMTEELEKSRELEEQLQEAEKSAVVGRLASAIAHEIRNPLNYINLTLDHLRKQFKPETEERRETFESLTGQLKSEVGRINRQVSDFLRYSKPPELNMAALDVRELISDSIHLIEHQAEEQGITISVVEREAAPPVFGDAEVLRSVFNNLFINAVQAMETSGGKLNVVISSSEGAVEVEIRDTGSGIPDDIIEKIFQPYFSTKETGTGLGLAIVDRIVRDHRGEISVVSPEGGGTTFTVRLPGARLVCPECDAVYDEGEICDKDGTPLAVRSGKLKRKEELNEENKTEETVAE